jgi:hypothetical protein
MSVWKSCCGASLPKRSPDYALGKTRRVLPLVAADLGLDERGVIVDILSPPVLAGFHLGEIVALYKLLDRSSTVRMLQAVIFQPKARSSVVFHLVPLE